MGDRYNTNARSPQELRAIAADNERRARRRTGDDQARALRRAQEFYADADKWEAEQAAEALRKSAHRKAALGSTQRRKDEFTAQYGTGAERDAARKRLSL